MFDKKGLFALFIILNLVTFIPINQEFYMKTIRAIHREYGVASEVLNAEVVELGNLKSGQVLVKLLRASVNPSDMGMIGGSYGRLRDLPAIAGREAIGEVVEVFDDVKEVKVGDIVRIPEEPGAWSQYTICDGKDLMILPKGLNLDMLAMSFVNPPTALLILEEFCELKAGDWVIQNGAGSALGYFLIQICHSRGIKTINILRSAAQKEADLKAIGADLVIDETEFDAKKLKELTGGTLPILGLNQIGGNSVSNMMKAMGQSGTIVTVGAMTSEPVRFPTRFLIFNDLRLRGFWWDKWQRTHSKEEKDAVLNKIFKMIEDGTLRAPVDKIYPLSEIKEAMKRAAEGGRRGKVLLSYQKFKNQIFNSLIGVLNNKTLALMQILFKFSYVNFYNAKNVSILAFASLVNASLLCAQEAVANVPLENEKASVSEVRELEKKFQETEAERIEAQKQKRREFFLESEARRQEELERRLEAERKAKKQKYKHSILSGLKGAAPELVADSPIDYNVETGKVVAKNNAKLSADSFEIIADEIIFNSKSGKASASGNVTISQENVRLLSDEISIDTKNNDFSAKYTRFAFAPLFAEIENVSTEARGKDDKKIKANDAIFYVGEPSFLSLNVKGSEFSYDSESDYVELKNAYLRLGDIPFFYVPYYGQYGLELPPIILQTRVGYNSDFGFKWQNTILYSGFGHVAPGMLFDVYSKRGVLVGPAANIDYKGGLITSTGELITGYINDQADSNILNSGLPAGQSLSRDRYFIDLKNIIRYDEKFQLTTVLNYWSDQYVMRDFRESIFDEDQMPDNFAEFSYTGETYNASVFTRFLPNSWEHTTQRLPEARIDIAPQRYDPFGIYYNFYASMGYYKEKFEDAVFETRDDTRFDAYFGLSRPINISSFASFTPIAGARITHFNNTVGGGNSYWRAVGQLGFDAQLQAWGVWQIRSKTLGLDGLRHSLRPIMQYRYIPNAEDGKKRIQTIDNLHYDTHPSTLDLGLMRNVDDLYNTNTLRVGIENVFETRSGKYGSREVARLNFYQDFNFDKMPYITNHLRKYSYSDFYIQASVSPAEWLNIANYTRINANNGDVAEVNSYIELHDADAWRVALGNIYLQSEINQYYLHAELRLTENYRLIGRWHYDYENSRFTDQVYALWTRVGNSWAVEYRISLKEGSKRENSLSVGANVRFLTY